MAGKLQAEIKQQKPFSSLEEEVYLNLQRTAESLSRRLVDELKASGLSPTQYNVLRILRGAGAEGLACGELAERMVTRDPDITRLLDRLEASGMVTRAREQKDRRVITTRITREGLRLLSELDPTVARLHKQQLQRLGKERLRAIIELLEQMRAELE
jgi:DNA-binding MarR family transcriptional regulator